MNKVIAARTALVLEQPFFGALALKLEVVEDPSCETAWVDGRTLGFNPAFVESLQHKEVVGLVAHEVMHCAMGHPWRRDGRDSKKWNAACDFAINSVLGESGFSIPEGALRDPTFDGKAAEWIYDRMPSGDDGQDGQQGGQGGQGDQNQPDQPSDQPGEVRDAPPDSAADATTEADWQQAVQQAAKVAKGRGELPGALDEFAKEAKRSRVDWKSVLRRFVQQAARADYSWTRPNPRFVAHGLYMPSLRSEEMGEIIVAVDTSASIDTVLLEQFAGEIVGIVEDLKPERLRVIYCDRHVHKVDEFERGDPIEIRAVGRGGTDLRPPFHTVDALGVAPACFIYLTDLDGTFPDHEPAYPVLWATDNKTRTAPFGEVVYCQ